MTGWRAKSPAEYMAKEFKGRKIAILHDNTAYVERVWATKPGKT